MTLYLTKREEIKDENGFSSRRIPRSDLDFQKIREHLTSDRCGYFSDPEFKKRSRSFEYSFGRLFLFCKQTVFSKLSRSWKKNKFPISNIQIHKADVPFFLIKVNINKRNSWNYKFQLENLLLFLECLSVEDKERRIDQLHLLNDLLRKNNNFFVLGNFNDPLSKYTLSWKTLSEGLPIFNTRRYVKQKCVKNKILTYLILTDLDLKQKLIPVPFSQNEGSFRILSGLVIRRITG